jgi:hypothetical protein
MSSKKNNRCATLADALDLTQWDYRPGKDRKLLLRPVGSVFADLPWEIRPQYLGPAPVAELETENDTDDGADTQPIEPLKE